MFKYCLLVACFLVVAKAQYFASYLAPPFLHQPPPPIGFLPVYSNNQTHNGFPNYNFTQNSTSNNSCVPAAHDLPGSHSLFTGCLKRNDSLLFSEVINKPARLFSLREKTIDYPGEMPPGHVKNRRISAIRCYDLKGNRKGGFAYITEGGISKTRVKLHLTSGQRNTGLFFRVEIYGQ